MRMKSDNRNNLYNWCIDNSKEYLLDEWDYEKNGTQTPKNVTPRSHNKYWWIKHYDDPNTKKHFVFSWESTPSNRIDGQGCPYLSSPIKKIFVGFNDLSTTNPDLAKEWNIEENDKLGIKITEVSRGSTKQVFWNCTIHGVYRATISDRTHGNACPYCAGKQVKVGFNDLATTDPELAKEWDCEKNRCRPDSVTRGCTKKYWWKCSLGHSFEQSPNNRTNNGQGCPYCTSKKVLVGFNDLESNYPEIAKEWNYEKNGGITPRDVVSKTVKVVWWNCKYGHEYQCRVSSRVLYGVGCKVCNSERKTSFPEKAFFYYIKKAFSDAEENKQFNWLGKKEIDIYVPSLKVGIEFDGYYWHKDISKDIKKDVQCRDNGVKLIRIRTKGCPEYISDSIKIEYSNDLNKAINELVEYLNKQYKCCINADVDVDRDYSIILENYISREKENSLAKMRPDIAAEWNYEKNQKLRPEFVSVHSNRKAWFNCPKCGDVYQTVINNRTGSKKSGCRVCSNKKIVKGINDLATKRPDLLAEWDYEKNNYSPYEISPATHKKVWWKCKNGHSWETAVYVRTTMNCGCPICAGQVAIKENSFAVLYPELLEEWDYEKNTRDPYTLLPNSNLKFWWKCSKCGYIWETNVYHRTARKSSCPLCANQVLVKGINDLETQFPEIAKEWNYEKNILKPYEVSGGTNKKYWWKCSKCGYEWECVVASRTKRNSKCPNCKKSKKGI